MPYDNDFGYVRLTCGGMVIYDMIPETNMRNCVRNHSWKSFNNQSCVSAL